MSAIKEIEKIKRLIQPEGDSGQNYNKAAFDKLKSQNPKKGSETNKQYRTRIKRLLDAANASINKDCNRRESSSNKQSSHSEGNAPAMDKMDRADNIHNKIHSLGIEILRLAQKPEECVSRKRATEIYARLEVIFNNTRRKVMANKYPGDLDLVRRILQNSIVKKMGVVRKTKSVRSISTGFEQNRRRH